MNLTFTEQCVLLALHAYHAAHGHMPTAKQLTYEMGWEARSPVSRNLNALARKGAIRFHPRALPVVLL